MAIVDIEKGPDIIIQRNDSQLPLFRSNSKVIDQATIFMSALEASGRDREKRTTCSE